jgi:hypothetical protein
MLAHDHSSLSLSLSLSNFKTQFLKQKLTADISLGLDAGPPSPRARVKLRKPVNRAGNEPVIPAFKKPNAPRHLLTLSVLNVGVLFARMLCSAAL